MVELPHSGNAVEFTVDLAARSLRGQLDRGRSGGQLWVSFADGFRLVKKHLLEGAAENLPRVATGDA
jgi:hypothetical protein